MKDETLEQHPTRPMSPASSTSTVDVESPDELTREKSHPDPPNGGLVAWLQVVSGFFCFFCSWGLINGFGVFQSYYSTVLPVSDSDISWIGSISSFLLCFMTVVYGPIFDRGHGRLLVIFGTFMIVFGMMMTSLSTKYYQLVLAQGVCMGLGSSAVFLTAIAVTPAYFTTKRSLAIGLCASGSSFGGIIWPIVVHKLQPQIGFPWTARVCAFMCLALMCIPIFCLRPRTRPPAKFLDLSACRDMTFNFFNFGCFIGMIGQYIPFFYMQQYASNIGNLSFYLLSILNVGSMVGRIIPTYLADRLGPMNVMASCTFIAGVVAFCWIPAHSTGGLVAVSFFYGLFSGAFVALQPASIVSMTKDVKTVGVRLGLNTMFAAFGLLIGNPVGGLLANNSWAGLQALCAATMCASAILVFITRGVVVGFRPQARA